MHRMKHAVTILAGLLLVASLAAAKGPFQAEGRISGVKRTGDEITLTFDGRISFSYATGNTGEAAARSLDLKATALTIQLRDWTTPYKPLEKASKPPAETVQAQLWQLEKSGRPIRMSIDNPAFAFSNAGRLVRITGTYIYAVDPAAAPAQR